MTTYTTIPNAAVAAGGRPRGSLMTALRDNLRAGFEGDPTAVAAGLTLLDAALDTGAATAAGTTWTGLRAAGLAVGAVGSYAFLTFNTLTTASPGTTHAGSGLRYSNASSQIGATPAGTWRLMGVTSNATQAFSTSLFLRIS